MKKLSILIFLGFMFTSFIYCQDYDKFKLGLGAGFTGGKGNGSKDFGVGGLFTIEPAYRWNDNIAIGLRLETAVFGEDSSGFIHFPEIISSITVNGQYYFSSEQFRPFVGIGLGIYFPAEFSTFGFYPRLGFDLGHFTLALEYNYASSSSNGYYFGVRIGGFFFGSKK
ncbi:MAG: hypothetical protein ACHQLA_08505 [Ignavibacteriales bacterium]